MKRSYFWSIFLSVASVFAISGAGFASATPPDPFPGTTLSVTSSPSYPNGAPLNTSVKYTVHVNFTSTAWSNSNGNGVSQGGKCVWVIKNSTGGTINQTYTNPSKQTDCDISFTDSFASQSSVATYQVTISNSWSQSIVLSGSVKPQASATNTAPQAIAQFSINGAAPSTSVTVPLGVPVHVVIDASRSKDPDGWTTPGTGVSQGGRCYVNKDFFSSNQFPYSTVIDNPSSPSACNVDAGMVTFTKYANNTTSHSYNVLRVDDAAGAHSYVASVIVNVIDSHQPIANVKISINGAPAATSVTVPAGVPVHVTLDASGSSDPDGWTAADVGVSKGGQCVWNTNVETTTPINSDKVISNPSSPSACNVDLGMHTFQIQSGVNQDRRNLLRITDASGDVSAYGVAYITAVNTPVNKPPVAVAQVKADSSLYGAEQAVTRGVPSHIYLGADLSSDPDGWTTAVTGVSQGGKCEWNTDLNTGVTTFEKTIANPSRSSVCNIDLGMRTFNDTPGRYVYPVLRVTDASGAISNIASITIVVLDKSANLAPVSIAQFSLNSAPPSPHIYVSRGVPVTIGLDASASYDPNGWTTAGTGMSQGGKCEWNTNLDQSRPTPFIKTIVNPANPSACNVGLGTLTFNDPPGTYTYVLLKLTDASGLQSILAYANNASHGLLARLFPIAFAQSADGSALVTIIDGPTPTPSTSPDASVTPTPSCNPFGYNPNCPPPTPDPTPTPTILPTTSVEPTITPDPCPPGSACTITEDVIKSVSDVVDTAKNVITNSIAKLLGVTPEDVVKFITEKGKSIASALASLALALSAPFLASNVLPAAAQWARFLGSFFTVHKKRDRWGIVVDSDLGNPIAQAVVQVFDAQFNQLKETQVTGADGQFGFLLPAGKYYIVVSEPGFVFPARRKPPVTLHDGERIYLGEEFEITGQDPEKVPHIVVPLDREEKVPAGNAVLRKYWDRFVEVVDRVGFIFLFIGGGINTYLLMLSPGLLNIAFEILYLLLFILKLYVMVSHQRGIGSVVDQDSRKKLDLSIIRLYDSKTNRIVQTKVTNKNGRFFILAPKGEYTASVAKPGYKTLLIKNLHIKGSVSKPLALNFALESIK